METLDLTHPLSERLLREALESTPPRLDLAAVAIATLERPTLSVDAVLHRLDALGARVASVLESGRTLPLARDKVSALRRVLVEEEGLRGNEAEYHQPDNSFIDQVLERRVGIPISLSAVWIEVARRAGIPLYGVGFPGHFLVALNGEEGRVVIDPFGAGRTLGPDDCAELLHRAVPNAFVSEELFQAATVRAIAWRMLSNLKRLYIEGKDEARALKVEDLLLQIDPNHPGELRSRAALLSSLGAYRGALRDLERALQLGNAPDLELLEATVAALRRRLQYEH